MEHLTFVNCLLLCIGLVMNLLYAIFKVKKEKKAFSFGYFISKNWIIMTLSVLAGLASVIMADDIMGLLHINTDGTLLFYKAHAFVSGLLPLQIIEKLKKLI